MNRQAFLHIPDSKFCFPTAADAVTIRLQTAADDKLDYVGIVYGNKYDYQTKRQEVTYTDKYTDENFCYYEFKIKLCDVRLVYIFKITQGSDTCYFCEDGIVDKFDFSLAYFNAFQLAYINKVDIHEVVPWMRDAVFYQIFVDRFSRGDKTKDDSYINLKWGELPKPKSFAGGDLVGITEKLDYIKSLGINALYLTPVFCSISNHKYDIYDYYNIDEQFGGNNAFYELVCKAHEKGVKVVLDAVFNHCSDRLPQFQDVLKEGDKSKYNQWFIKRGNEFECFAACKYMPKFNTSNVEVQQYLFDIAKYWIEKYDIDGWRLDVGDEVSHEFWRGFRRAVKSSKSNAVIIGENWHDAYPYLLGDQYDSIMNYAVTKACMDFFVSKTLDAVGFSQRLTKILMRNTDAVNTMMLNLLDSHDTHRFLSLLENDIDRLICALAVIFMWVGVPCVYYGTEIALVGGYDPDCRRTFDWEKAHEETELKKVMRSLAKLKSRSELKFGGVSLRVANGLFVMERHHGGSKLRLIVNNTENKINYKEQAVRLIEYKANEQCVAAGGFIIEEAKGI